MSNPTTDVRSHYGLTAIPFTREIAVKDRYRGPLYDEPLSSLRDTLDKRMSAALIAPAGTGKTMLLRCLCQELPEARYRVHYIKVTALSKRDFCRELCLAVGAEPAGSYNMLVRRLDERILATYHDEALRPVLILDEAHDLRPDVLAILRVLTNFEMDSRLVLGVILAGQPPLRAMLQRNELEAVSRRLAHIASLRLLSRAETAHYVRHRSAIVQAKDELFDPSGHDALFEIAGGNLRATDHLALKALELGVQAQVQTVSADLVVKARPLVLA